MPGDILTTGTSAGVAVFSNAPFLKEGDVRGSKRRRIGSLINPVRSEE